MIKGDIFVIALTIIIALFIIPILSETNNNNTKSLVKITYNDTVKYADLYGGDTIELENNGYHLILVIENGTVYISKSDCPDGICRSMRGFIVCVPAEIQIEAVSGGSHEIVAG